VTHISILTTIIKLTYNLPTPSLGVMDPLHINSWSQQARGIAPPHHNPTSHAVCSNIFSQNGGAHVDEKELGLAVMLRELTSLALRMGSYLGVCIHLVV
jgi:hypothetical protein